MIPSPSQSQSQSQSLPTFHLRQQPGNLYTNFDPAPFPQNCRQKVRALILGHCGNGKTHFLNRISGKNYQAGFRRGSLTRDIAWEDAFCLDKGALRIYDTPGTNAKKQALLHAQILRKSLELLPLNLVMIQSKLDARFEDNTFNQLLKQVKLFQKYKSNVVFLISHLDILKDKPQQQIGSFIKQFNYLLQQLKIQTKIILYSNITSNFQDLTKILYTLGITNSPHNIILQDKLFFKYLNISQSIDKISLQNDKIQKYKQQIYDISQSYMKYLQKIPNPSTLQISSQNNDIVSALKSSMKEELKAKQKEQYEQYNNQMGQQHSMELFLFISQLIHAKLEELDLKAEGKVKKIAYFSVKKMYFDVRDLLKKCPHCGLLWMRTQGCQGETSCGGKPIDLDVMQTKKSYKHQFKLNSQTYQLSYEKTLQQSITQQQVNKVREQRQKNTKKLQALNRETKDVGCHKLINWKQLPYLPNIEQLLKQLYNISNFQQIQWDYNRIMQEKDERRKLMDSAIRRNQEMVSKSLIQ